MIQESCSLILARHAKHMTGPGTHGAGSVAEAHPATHGWRRRAHVAASPAAPSRARAWAMLDRTNLRHQEVLGINLIYAALTRLYSHPNSCANCSRI